MRLDIDSLRTFKTVLDLGGVTRAARKLSLTQSAVSHKLARLEERIGRPILVKGSGGFVPTADGRRLLHYAERLVALHDEAAEYFRQSDLSGEVRLGATEDAADRRLAGVLGRFRRLHPRVTLRIRVAQSLVLQEWLDRGDVDLAVMQVFVPDRRPGDRELWREDLVWAEADDHPQALGRTVPFVSFDHACFYRQAAEAALAREGRALDVVMECPSAEGVRAGVRHGLGVALLGRRNLQPGLAEIGAGLPALPPVSHVLRSGRALAPALENGLAAAVAAELGETP